MNPIPFTALPSLIDWPRDEAAHDGLAWEIWWITATLHAGDRRFAAHVMFHHPGGGDVHVTASLTDLDKDEVVTRRLNAAAAQAVLAHDVLRIETTLSRFWGSFDEGYSLVAAFDDGVGFDLTFKPRRPVLHNGGAGEFRFQGTVTTQYSIGGLETSGTVRLAGDTLAVTGTGWYDRQWEVAKRANQLVFTWFGLCLDNGDTLSVFDTGEGGHSWATIARPDGTHIVTVANILAADRYETGMGRTMPRRWNLSLPAMRAQLQLEQRRVSDDPRLYTGVLDVKGRYEDSEAHGHGFCDVVGPLIS